MALLKNLSYLYSRAAVVVTLWTAWILSSVLGANPRLSFLVGFSLEFLNFFFVTKALSFLSATPSSEKKTRRR